MSLPWRYEETRDSEFARCRGAGYVAVVRDCDGDFTRWHVLYQGETVGEGESHSFDPYHFDVGMGEAEAVLRNAVGWHKSRLRTKSRRPDQL